MSEERERVVLLHGLARSPRSLAAMAAALREAGFAPILIGYPSRQHPIEVLASRHVVPALQRCGAGRCHFVTHSLGGIVLRQIRRAHPEIAFGRVVMLGPPNQGSEIVDRCRHQAWFRWLNGPAGQQLGTDAEALPNRLGPADFELGIIAGDRPFFEPLWWLIPGASDGKVAVARTRLAGQRDALVLPVSHAAMMRDRRVIDATIGFLGSGRFLPSR